MGIAAIITGAIKPIGDFFNRRQEIKAANHQAELKVIEAQGTRTAEAIKEDLHADAAWELEQIKNSGYKDEWVLLVISVPLVGCFIPSIAPHILRGFEVLAKTPDWYQWLIMLIFTAVYGIRLWRRQQTDT